MSQKMDALKKANDIRLERAQLKAKIYAKTVNLQDVLALPPRCINTMMIYDLLNCQRGWGEHKILTLLNKNYILPHKQIQDITQRQRELLASKLK